VCTLHGLPVAFALAGAKADERKTVLGRFNVELEPVAVRPGQTLIGDKNYFGRDFERRLEELQIRLLRPARKGEAERTGSQLSNRCGRSSSRSMRRSRASSTSNAITAGPRAS
jgi:hypothetical protein